MFYFILFYFIALYALLMSKEIIFFNEEILIAVCMSLVFFFLVRSTRKLINFAFFFRIEYIYFSFLTVISLNIKLIDKMLTLLNLESLRFESLFIPSLYSFFFDFTSIVLRSTKLSNLMLVKNFIFSFVAQFYALNFLFSYSNFLSKVLVKSDNLLQEFDMNSKDNFIINRNSSFEIIESILYSQDLYEIFLDGTLKNDLYLHFEDIFFLSEIKII